jgi:hypothetical protein
LASDFYGNISPAPQLPPGGWVNRYPVEHYSLDQYFPAISVGFTSGVDASGVAPMIAYFGAQVIWLITSFLANGVILLFALAFNLNLLTGNGTSGAGALTPVSQAIHNLYTNTFGTPWLIAMVTLVGCWAMWKALVQRRYTETAAALAVSFIYFLLAIGIVTQPEKTIAPASKLSNELSTALLSLTNEGSVTNEGKAKTGASNQLFELLVLDPWTVLEFGGLEHCATLNKGKPHSVKVRPLSSNPTQDTQLASQLENGTEVKGESGKTCINNRNKYAAHFLQYPFQSKDRNSEHEALEHGDTKDLPDSDPAKTSGTYTLAPVDEPAVESMGKDGQYQRLLLAIVILLGEAGAYLLLGALALGVILAQILLLALLAFAPVALLIGLFPGRGHEFFRAWIAKLLSYLARKVLYSLILAIVLAVCSALDNATSNLGWLLAFALQAAFLWTIFIQRNRLTRDLLSGTVGPRAASEDGNRLANLYFASRLARMLPLPNVTRGSGSGGSPPATGASSGSGGPESESPESPPGGSPGPAGFTPNPTDGEGPSLPVGSAQHETPTHGPSAPAPGSPAGSGEESAPGQESETGDATSRPPAAMPASPPVPADGSAQPTRPVEPGDHDELPPADETHRSPQSPPTKTGTSSGQRGEPPVAERTSTTAITSAGTARPTTTVVSSAAAAPPPLQVGEPPAAPQVDASPGMSALPSRDEALSEDPAPAPSRDARHPESDRGPSPSVEPSAATEQATVEALQSLQSAAPTDHPTTTEDEPA